MILIRVYLLAGLVLHKALWEVMKRRERGSAKVAAARTPPRTRIVKAVKVAILAGVAVQTMAPEVLPISGSPALLRVVGLCLYTAGLAMAMTSRLQLAGNWSDIEAARVERDHRVVSSGFYRYIRHPIYVGDLLLLAGLELSLNSWLVLGVVLMAPFVLAQAVREERMLVQALPGYGRYCSNTKRFIPFVV